MPHAKNSDRIEWFPEKEKENKNQEEYEKVGA